MRRLFVGLAISFATLTPTWALANDKQIAQQIIQKLEQQKQAGQLTGFGIDLQVDDGTVFMNGRVATPEQQQMALGVAQRTAGVKQVVNGLQIGSQTPETKEAVKPAGGWNSAMKSSFAGSEQPAAEARQVANQEVVPATRSVITKVPSAPRIQQSQMVAAQEPAYQMPEQPQNLSPRITQSQMQHGGQQVTRATMPGHVGPSNRPQPQPLPYRQVGYNGQPMAMAPAGYGQAAPMPAQMMGGGTGIAPARYDQPQLPGYAWPSYASHPNYAAVTYPKQYSPTAWPYIGPFYPYPQVPLGWRKVTLEWDDGWWMLDFHDQNRAWKPHR